MDIEKKKRFIVNFFYFVILFGLSILIVRFALPALFPFAIAFLVTLLLRPVVNFIVRKLHINRNAISVLFVLLFYGTIGLVVVLLIIKLINSIGSWIAKLPDFFNQTIVPALRSAGDGISAIIENFDSDGFIDLDDAAAKLISSLSTMISDFSGKALAFVSSYATSVPTWILNIVITIISSAFLLIDYDSIKEFVAHQLPDEKRKLISSIATHLKKVIWKYITSYLFIMVITFAEISIGLICIGQKNPFGIAAGIAALDILPVVGSGLILLPWSVISMLSGSLGKGIGLLVLWAILSVIRQIIEPKIVGDTVGMHPLLTLFGMLFGNFVYGGLGIFLVPITIALCQSLQRQGIIHIYKS
ncbi:MAG: sporulation integral membrane protein YtvI, partial [Clostridiales bacterium]|nr:sporulation integral membrane protein YtvI [Clostridiales bacterium]